MSTRARLLARYRTLRFPHVRHRPWVFANFVTTLDGKVAVKTKRRGYWPLGSQEDYAALHALRCSADLLMHGRATAERFATLKSLQGRTFRAARVRLGQSPSLPYLVVSAHPTPRLAARLSNPRGSKSLLVTTRSARVPKAVERAAEVLRFGRTTVDLKALLRHLRTRGYRNVLCEGGSTLMGSLFRADVVDELFLTLAPKILGTSKATQTLAEGTLLPPASIRKARLISSVPLDSELFLRYRFLHTASS